MFVSFVVFVDFFFFHLHLTIIINKSKKYQEKGKEILLKEMFVVKENI